MTATFDTRLIAPKDVDGLLALWRETWIATYGIVLGAGTLANMLAELDQHEATGMLPGADDRGYCIALRKEIIGSAIIAERGETAYLWECTFDPIGNGEEPAPVFYSPARSASKRRKESRSEFSVPAQPRFPSIESMASPRLTRS